MRKNDSWLSDRERRAEERRLARQERLRAWIPLLDPVTYWIAGSVLAGVCVAAELAQRFAIWAGLA